MITEGIDDTLYQVQKSQRVVFLVVSKDKALLKILSIPHEICKQGFKSHWHVDADNRVKAQSVCWLYCWAKTGMGSNKAAFEAEQIFNNILNIKVSDFDTRVPDAHEWARKNRYTPNDIENEFATYFDCGG